MLDDIPMVAEDLNNVTADMDNSAWLLKYAYIYIYSFLILFSWPVLICSDEQQSI